jgi:hypothetical protein
MSMEHIKMTSDHKVYSSVAVDSRAIQVSGLWSATLPDGFKGLDLGRVLTKSVDTTQRRSSSGNHAVGLFNYGARLQEVNKFQLI